MEIRLLGAVEVVSGGVTVPLGGPKQRACLVGLVLQRGREVSAERLVDLLWAEAAPPTAAKTVHVFISRLRKALGAGAILTTPAGYRLAVEEVAVDAWRFEQLLDDGRAQLETGSPGQARRTLQSALSLWRGPALADVSFEPFLQPEIARLEELRVAAVEDRIEADLQLGRSHELVAELNALVREHPFRERIRGQLMVALYRSGRQADALDAYRDARTTFIEELGLEPSPALRELEAAVLAQDTSLGSIGRGLRRARSSRRTGSIAGIAALLVAGGAAAIVAWSGESVTASPPAVAPDSVALIDPHRDAVAATIPVGSGPVAVTAGGGSVWVADAGDQTLARIDPAARQIVDRIGLRHIPTQLAYGRGALWIASAIGERGVVSRVDPLLRTVVSDATVRVRGGAGDDLFAAATPSAIAAGAPGVVTNDLHSSLWWQTGSRTRRLALGASRSADGLAIGAGAVWVASSDDDSVLRLDPETGRVAARIPIAAVRLSRVAGPYGIAAGNGAVWVADTLAGAVSRIDPRLNAATATIDVGGRPTRLALGAGAVWVLDPTAGTVARIDPAHDAVAATIRIGPGATGIAADKHGVWVTVAGGRPHARLPIEPGPVTALSSPRCGAIEDGAGHPDVLIASDLPTMNPGPAPDPAMLDIRRAIQRVLAQRGFRAGRFRVGYQACDDSRPGEGPDPDLCASNARAYALDASLVGVIGAYNSSCTSIELPILESAPVGPVATISPSNTYVGLTHTGPDTPPDEPDRYYPAGTRNFTRLVASDDYQSAGIDLFLRQLGHSRLYVLDDGGATGYAGAVYAERAASRVGIRIVGRATWDATTHRYAALARQIAATQANAVLLSGCICSDGAALVGALRRDLGNRVVLIGTDNFADLTAFAHSRTFDGMYISGAGLPASALPARGQTFLRGLFPRRPFQDIGKYVAYAAAATGTLLDAIAGSDGTRTAIVRRLLATHAKAGLTGPMSFDRTGDPSHSPIAIYRVDSSIAPTPHNQPEGLVPVRIVNPTKADNG